jgi:hypothetical protein
VKFVSQSALTLLALAQVYERRRKKPEVEKERCEECSKTPFDRIIIFNGGVGGAK